VKMKSSLGAEQEIQRNEMGDVMGVRAGEFSASFERDILGLEMKRAFGLEKSDAPASVWSKWERDAFGRPTKQHRQGRATPETTRFYEWDVDDRLKQVGQSGYSGNWDSEYTHDALGNLQSAKHWSAKATEFERRMPDAVGNLFRTEDRSDRQYGPAGELRAAAGKDGITRYEYDAEGNLSKKTEANGREWTYEWNMAGMLVKVHRPDGCVVEFGYDALGRRMWKKFRGHLTKWVWDGNNPLHEWVEEVSWSPPRPPVANDGTTPKGVKPELWPVTPQGPPSPELGVKDAPITWLFEPESFAPLGKVVAGAAYGIVTDHLGTPVSMYDAKGAEVWGGELGIYGHVRRLKGPRQLCPFRRPGQYEDVETGLYYNRFRYYDPVAGAYVSQDPIGLAGGGRFHAYPKDPLRAVDPLGLTETCGVGDAASLSRSLRTGEQRIPDSVLYRTKQKGPRGVPFGSPRNPDPPSLSVFNPRVYEMDAGKIHVNSTMHPTNAIQGGPVGLLSNDELVRFRLEDPISSNGLGAGRSLDVTGGHHRLAEIQRRVDAGLMPPDQKVWVLLHD
jgi:RHS repeat-associated protein